MSFRFFPRLAFLLVLCAFVSCSSKEGKESAKPVSSGSVEQKLKLDSLRNSPKVKEIRESIERRSKIILTEEQKKEVERLRKLDTNSLFPWEKYKIVYPYAVCFDTVSKSGIFVVCRRSDIDGEVQWKKE